MRSPSERRVAFATCSAYPSLTEEDRRVAMALAARSIHVEPLVWDADGEVPDVDAVVLRSCWDYHEKTDAFVGFLGRLGEAGIRCLNSPRVATWNLDKRYLFDLERTGTRIPRTIRVERGERRSLCALLEESTLDEAVVKPVVGMLGVDTWRTSRATASRDAGAFAELVARRPVFVQEFVTGVLDQGEISIVFIAGRFSHAVQKRPARAEFRVHEEHGGTRRAIVPSSQWLAQAERALASVGEPLLYARFDGIPCDDELVLMELELIDPSLFLAYDPDATSRFADAIASLR